MSQMHFNWYKAVCRLIITKRNSFSGGFWIHSWQSLSNWQQQFTTAMTTSGSAKPSKSTREAVAKTRLMQPKNVPARKWKHWRSSKDTPQIIYSSVSQPFGLQVPVEDNFMSYCLDKPRIVHMLSQKHTFIYSKYQLKEGIALFLFY